MSISTQNFIVKECFASARKAATQKFVSPPLAVNTACSYGTSANISAWTPRRVWLIIAGTPLTLAGPI